MAVLLNCLVDRGHLQLGVKEFERSQLGLKLGNRKTIAHERIAVKSLAAVCFAALHLLFYPWKASDSTFQVLFVLLVVPDLLLLLLFAKMIALLLALYTEFN
mmetsp:Transcript_22926/g.26890  ORF Transcript_22926/g.26890 Transcript_22926/m.26890 type:complete len:102 (+) Transcript_22926:380-685(+)